MNKDNYFMRLALDIAQASKCVRAKYGSVIVSKDGRVVATGYNGKPRGSINDHICYREGFVDNARFEFLNWSRPYRVLELSQDQVSYISEIDYEWASQWKWYLSSTGYAVRNKRKDDKNPSAVIRLHREVLRRTLLQDFNNDLEVDHISGNSLDNRRENLRMCTHAENLRNGKIRTNNTSGYPGVSKHQGGWRAVIKKDGEYKFLGQFSTPELARDAYRRSAEELFGEFAPSHLITAGNCCLHSETNAILFSTPEEREGATIYVSGIPCTDCALLISQSKFARCVYLNTYASSGHMGNFDLEFAQKYGMKTEFIPLIIGQTE